ncbi:hypothetical protein [Streptomyces sp. NBC_01615]|uniref:hypothetical protein n=1 Tax=Streptomyces sp. NBC_01615 TaxID=2975898 RepID=UPI00386C76DE
MIKDLAGLACAAEMRLALAGIDWDVIKVSRFLGLRAIENMSDPGAITVDLYPAAPSLYFFVPVGAAAGWRMPQTMAFGRGMTVLLPPDHKEAPPGPFWLIQRSHGLTQAAELRRELEAARGPSATSDDEGGKP